MVSYHIDYVEETYDAPFLLNGEMAIFLTDDGDVYVGPHTIKIGYGIRNRWRIDNRLRGNIINYILKEIEPYILEILQSHNYVETQELYKKIQDTIYRCENNLDNIRVKLMHFSNYRIRSKIPPEFRDYIDNEDLLIDSGIKFYESSEEIYEELTEELADKIYDNSVSYNSSYDSVSDIITSIYSEYKKKGYINDFWNDLIPELLDLDYDNIYTVSGKNIYYDDQLIDL